MAVRKGTLSVEWRAGVGPAALPVDEGAVGEAVARTRARAGAGLVRADTDSARAAAGSAGCGDGAGASAGGKPGGEIVGSSGWPDGSKPSSARKGNCAEPRRCRERGAAGVGWTFSTDGTARGCHRLRSGCTTAPSTPPVRKMTAPASATRRVRSRHADFLRSVWRMRPFSRGTGSAGDLIALRTSRATSAGSSCGRRPRIRMGSEGNRFMAPSRWTGRRIAWLARGASEPIPPRR